MIWCLLAPSPRRQDSNELCLGIISAYSRKSRRVMSNAEAILRICTIDGASNSPFSNRDMYPLESFALSCKSICVMFLSSLSCFTIFPSFSPWELLTLVVIGCVVSEIDMLIIILI